VPDAEAIRRVLESQNVEVYYVHDCNSAEFWHQFALFETAIHPGDAVFFYFAGHGVTFKNSVRLMTISDSAKPDIEKDGVNLDVLLARMSLCNTSLIVSFLDCCRDFVFESSEVSEGLTRGKSDKVGQHLTLFACAPNASAYDGKGDHGAFTEILLKYLQIINLDLDELAHAVTKEMVDKYGEQQMPHRAGALWCKWFLFTEMKYIRRGVNILSLKKQVRLFEKKLKNSMDQYCRFLVSHGVPKDLAQGLAMKARL